MMPSGFTEPNWLPPLQAAVSDVAASWRTPQLATVDKDGRPQVRTVVLRSVDQQQDALVLQIHSHASAGKVSDILHTSDVALCFWDPHAQHQLRLSGTAQVHTQTIQADMVWTGLSVQRRGLYDVTGRPGAPLEDTHPYLSGRSGFAVIEILVKHADILDLNTRPHVRVQWTFTSSDGWQKTSVHP